MTNERFQEIKANIKENFVLEDEYQEDLDPGIAENLQFVGPQGKMLLRFVTRPKLLDKKTTFSNRAGSDVKVDYVYSQDETSSHLEIYRWLDDKEDWEKIDSDSLFN